MCAPMQRGTLGKRWGCESKHEVMDCVCKIFSCFHHLSADESCVWLKTRALSLAYLIVV